MPFHQVFFTEWVWNMAAGSPANPLPTHLSSHPHVVSLVIFNSSWWNPRISVSGCGKIPKVSRFLWVKIRVWNRLPQSPTVYHQFTKENSHKLCYPPFFRHTNHILSWFYIPLPYPQYPLNQACFLGEFRLWSIGSSLKSLSFRGDTNFDSSDASLYLSLLKPLHNFFRRGKVEMEMEGMMRMTGLICECGEFAAGLDLVALVTQIKSNIL